MIALIVIGFFGVCMAAVYSIGSATAEYREYRRKAQIERLSSKD